MNYIATDPDRLAIYGVGATPEAAIAQACAVAGDPSAAEWLVAVQATPQLVALVETGAAGGACQWTEADGIADIAD